MYGFSKVEGGPSHGSYVHPDFHKNDQAKTLTIKRHSSTPRIRPHCRQVQEVVRSHCSTPESSSQTTTCTIRNSTPKKWSGVAQEACGVRLGGSCVAAAPATVTQLGPIVGSRNNNIIISRDPSPVPCCTSPRTTTSTCSSRASNVGVVHPDDHHDDPFLLESNDHSCCRLFESRQTMSIGDSFDNVVWSMSMVPDHESEFEPRPIELMLRSYYSVS